MEFKKTHLRLSQNRGYTLVSILITTAITAIVMLGFLRMYKYQTKATRNIAAHGGITDLTHSLDVLFSSPNCATSGTGNYLQGTTTPVTVATVTGPPASYSLTMNTLKFPSGSVAITTGANSVISNMIQPYSISSIVFTPLGGSSANRYPFQMTVNFASASGPPPVPLHKFINIYTNASSNVIGACYSGGAGFSCVQRVSTTFEAYGNATISCAPDETIVSCTAVQVPTGVSACSWGLNTATGVCAAYCNSATNLGPPYKVYAVCCRSN